MHILGFQKTTLLDYPKHLAATIFLGGCNFRCPFCHNVSLVLYPDQQPILSEDEVFSVLIKRRHLLEGVCITGGEPTIHKELPALIEKIKNLGLDVKLDTNGTNPDMLSYLMEQSLIDFISMDIKNSPSKYNITAGLSTLSPDKINASASLLMSAGVPYEFRTTVVREYHESSDFLEIGRWLCGASSYYLQSYQDSGNIISPGLHACTKKELTQFLCLVKPYFASIGLRGVN